MRHHAAYGTELQGGSARGNTEYLLWKKEEQDELKAGDRENQKKVMVMKTKKSCGHGRQKRNQGKDPGNERKPIGNHTGSPRPRRPNERQPEATRRKRNRNSNRSRLPCNS